MTDKDTVFQNFEELFRKAGETLQADASAEQAIVVQTTGGAVHSFANHGVMAGNRKDETAFIEALAKSGDTRVLRMVCVWQAGLVVDLPSMNLRKTLAELDPDNRDGEILLWTGEGYATKSIGASI